MHRVFLAVMAALCAVAAMATIGAAGASGSGGSKNDLRASCEQERYGSTYITSLKARNTKCKTAKRVAKKFTDCRKDNGGAKGHCNETVAHYSCNEGDREGNKFQYNAKVKCERGSNKVVFTYTQQT